MNIPILKLKTMLKPSDPEKEEKINCLIDRLRCDVEMYERNMILSGFVKLKEILKKLHLYDPIYFSSSDSQEEPSKIPKASRSAVKKNN